MTPEQLQDIIDKGFKQKYHKSFGAELDEKIFSAETVDEIYEVLMDIRPSVSDFPVNENTQKVLSMLANASDGKHEYIYVNGPILSFRCFISDGMFYKEFINSSAGVAMGS